MARKVPILANLWPMKCKTRGRVRGLITDSVCVRGPKFPQKIATRAAICPAVTRFSCFPRNTKNRENCRAFTSWNVKRGKYSPTKNCRTFCCDMHIFFLIFERNETPGPVWCKTSWKLIDSVLNVIEETKAELKIYFTNVIF